MMSVRVIKLGGSLLDLPDLAQAWSVWLRRQSPAAHLVVIGGGAAANKARQLAARQGLSDAQLHWLCIDAMFENARSVRRQVPGLAWLPRRKRLVPHCAGTWLVRPRWFMEAVEPGLGRYVLPVGDDATSDSIAARVAQWSQAQELVLLKSIHPATAKATLQEAALQGWVDRCFPQAAASIPQILMVNLRNDPNQDWPLEPN